MSIMNRVGRLMAGSALLSAPSRPPLLVPATARPASVIHSLRGDATGSPQEILAALQKSVTDFRAEYDTKLKSKADVVTEEKLSRIDASVSGFQAAMDKINAEHQAAIDAVNAKLAAISAGAGDKAGFGSSPEDREYATRFDAYVRRGDREADDHLRSSQRTGIRAAMSVGSNPDGGYLAPVEWDRSITDRLKVISPMRQIAQVQNITSAGFIKVFNDRAVGSGWVGETAARPQTTNPQFATQTYTPGEIYANPAASQQLLDDAVINIEEWLANEVEAEFLRQEGLAFVNGDGVNKPKGMLTYTASNMHPWGAVQQTAVANAAALNGDALIDLVYSIDPAYQDNARFVMNRATQSTIRKLKDGNGNYLWQASVQVGQPASLLGYPITDMGAMPNVGAGNRPIAFGDFRRAYLIIDRMGVRMLRDPYSNKPYVMFYTTRRVGGGLLDPDAIRYLFVTA